MLTEIGDDPRQAEDQLPGARSIVLGHLAVDPGADAQGVRARLGGGDEFGTQRSEAVPALRAHIRALVRGLHVVEAEVVRGGHPGHMGPGLGLGDAAGGGADDDGDLALEGQQRGPRRPFDRLPRRGHGAAGLEEVGRLCRSLPALGRTGLIGHMDGNDLARTGGNTRSRHRTHTSFRLASPQIVYDTVPENK